MEFGSITSSKNLDLLFVKPEADSHAKSCKYLHVIMSLQPSHFILKGISSNLCIISSLHLFNTEIYTKSL